MLNAITFRSGPLDMTAVRDPLSAIHGWGLPPDDRFLPDSYYEAPRRTSRITGLGGLACPYGVLGRPLAWGNEPHRQDVRYYFTRGSFDDAIARTRAGTCDVKLLIEHQYRRQLASTRDGSLLIWSGRDGLMFCTLTETPEILQEAVREPRWRCSFGGSAGADAEVGVMSDGFRLCMPRNYLLIEITLTANPNFTETKTWPLSEE